MPLQHNISIYRYSENPDKFRPLIYDFMVKAQAEGSDGINPEKYNPDNLDIETWLCFIEDGTLISICAVEASYYTNDPQVAARCCRYHILKKYRFTHCGLRMADLQIDYARKKGFEILYITHDIQNTAINALYQRKKKIPVSTFKEFLDTEWYQNLKLEKNFLFRTGERTIQYVYSIRLNNPNFIWEPESKFIVRDFDESITQCA